MSVDAAYDSVAHEWESSAGPVYGPLGQALVGNSPITLAGKTVLDVGCGSGAIARSAAAMGARVAGVDRSLPMLHGTHGDDFPRSAADILSLPFRNDAFDVAIAGFVINHVPPVQGLAELVRVVGSGGAVLASSWSAASPTRSRPRSSASCGATDGNHPSGGSSYRQTWNPSQAQPPRSREPRQTLDCSMSTPRSFGPPPGSRMRMFSWRTDSLCPTSRRGSPL